MKTEPIHLQRGLTLYKQPLSSRGGSPYWYARVWMRIGDRTVHTKSTGTTDAAAAKRFAEDFYAQCMMRRLYGDLPGSAGAAAVATNMRFDVLADEWLGQKKAIAGSDPRQVRAYDDARKLVTAPNGLGAYFKRTDISSITTDMVRKYLCFAAEHSKKGQLAATTQRNHLSALNGILKFAAERRIIAAPPPMPRLRLKDNTRPCFTDVEFRGLWLSAGFLGRSAGYRGNIRAAADWEEFQDFLTFMISTFLRPAEWKQLRQRHCRIIYGDHPYLAVAVPNGKTGIRKVVSMPEAIGVFERIVERDGDDPERFLFRAGYQNRTTAYERMRDLFEAALAESGFGLDEFGKKRTMYRLYVDPPAHAITMSFDEKSQIQALYRTPPGLPLKRGRLGTMTHDYKRNGTTTLFAAQNLLDGTGIGRNMQRPCSATAA